MTKIVLFFLLLIKTPLLMGSGFQEGLAAYNRGDFATAMKEWQPIAEQGDANAQYNLGLIFARGGSTPPNDQQAAAWYQKAAAQGVVAAQYNLGMIYATGQGIPRDMAEAARWFRQAAEKGMPEAEFNLAAICEGDTSSDGGAIRNYPEAANWYRKAAGHGIAAAAFRLGVLYDLGEGVTKDYDEALKWYRMAADGGYAGALTNIGILYYNAQGVKRDLVQSYVWLARGGHMGDPRAVDLLQITAGRMTPKQIKTAQALTGEWHPSAKLPSPAPPENLFAPVQK